MSHQRAESEVSLGDETENGGESQGGTQGDDAPAPPPPPPPPPPNITPSHQRSVAGQTAASLARAASQTGATEGEEQPPPKSPIKKRTGTRSSNTLGEQEASSTKPPRKGSEKWVSEQWEVKTGKLQSLVQSMVTRIEDTESSAASTEVEIHTLRDKIAKLEGEIQSLRDERANTYDTGTDSDGNSRRRSDSGRRNARRAEKRKASSPVHPSKRSRIGDSRLAEKEAAMGKKEAAVLLCPRRAGQRSFRIGSPMRRSVRRLPSGIIHQRLGEKIEVEAPRKSGTSATLRLSQRRVRGRPWVQARRPGLIPSTSLMSPTPAAEAISGAIEGPRIVGEDRRHFVEEEGVIVARIEVKDKVAGGISNGNLTKSAPPAPAFPVGRPEVVIGQVLWTTGNTRNDLMTFVDKIKTAGFGPVPVPRRVSEPLEGRSRHIVAVFADRREAGVFAKCWSRWAGGTDWENTKAEFADSNVAGSAIYAE
ncbi:hypothetical protein DFH09DRAFT_1418520 [Mycena vulgaris]|nr:hypothetical protein DFH09DRAFT_1418520 [Mycena vulgaris]